LDIEIAEHDFSTLAIALYGNQTKSIDDGIYTLYDLKITYIDNTTYTKLETNLMSYYMRLDKIEVIILILVKTLQI
jgi:hypothetical protein